MTRQEFIDDVNDFWDLKEVCDDNHLTICDDVYDRDTYEEMIDENVFDWARSDHWWELRDRLNDLPTGCDWYYYSAYGWEEADFYTFKDDVLDEMDRLEAWDCEEDEDDAYDDDYDDGVCDDTDFDPRGEDEPEISNEAFFFVLKEAV